MSLPAAESALASKTKRGDKTVPPSYFVEIYYRNMLQYLAKHRKLACLLVGPLIRLGALARCGVIGRWR